MASVYKKGVHLLFDLWRGHCCRAEAVGAGQAGRGAKKPADQRPFGVHQAALRAEMDAVQACQCRLMGRLAFSRQSGSFCAGGGDRAAAIMAAWSTGEGRNLAAEETDFLVVATHKLFAKILGWLAAFLLQ